MFNNLYLFSAEETPARKVIPKDGSTYGTYTEEDFNKEFGNDFQDTNSAFEEDTTKETITDFKLIEREEMTVDDLADTISSSIGNPNRNSYVLRVKFPKEDPRTIDIDIADDTKIIVNSHKYKLRAYFQKPVLPSTLKSSFTRENDELELCVRQK